MIVNGIGTAASNSAYVSSTKSSDSTTDLGIDDFFTLMAAQLQNQSMSDTVDNTQFIAQMAQFASLSQISELNSTTQSNTALSMLGKTVSVLQTDTSGAESAVVGEVSQISYSEGEPYICVSGGYYKLADIIDISD
jgi:flagellar basal-body rod modification protein FlgD